MSRSRATAKKHRDEAAKNYLKYEEVQDKIEAMEERAKRKSARLASVELTGDTGPGGYMDLCSDRERYMKMAQLHALMAIMHSMAAQEA